MRKHERDVKKTVESLGLEFLGIDHLGSGHIRIMTNVGFAITGSTPSDRRAGMYLKSHLKRMMR